MKSIEELSDLMVELLESVDSTSGKLKFPARATEIIKEISEYAKTTPFYKQNEGAATHFWNDEPPEEIWMFMLQKIIGAPAAIYRDTSVLGHMPALEKALAAQRRCRVCGCTDENACPGGCYWVEDDLCSRCVGKEAGT